MNVHSQLPIVLIVIICVQIALMAIGIWLHGFKNTLVIIASVIVVWVLYLIPDGPVYHLIDWVNETLGGLSALIIFVAYFIGIPLIGFIYKLKYSDG